MAELTDVIEHYFALTIDTNRNFDLEIDGFYETNTWLLQIKVPFYISSEMHQTLYIAPDIELPVNIDIDNNLIVLRGYNTPTITIPLKLTANIGLHQYEELNVAIPFTIIADMLLQPQDWNVSIELPFVISASPVVYQYIMLGYYDSFLLSELDVKTLREMDWNIV